jgi:hypothetical protein
MRPISLTERTDVRSRHSPRILTAGAIRFRYNGGVPRHRLAAALVLAAACLAGCDGGNGDRGAGSRWEGPPDPAADGSVSVEDFAGHQADVDEPWERSSATAAAEFLRVDEAVAARLTIDRTAPGEGGGPETVVVTLDGLFDDSVRAERWTLVLEPEDGAYVLTSAARALRCQAGRGHEDFSAEPCL